MRFRPSTSCKLFYPTIFTAQIDHCYSHTYPGEGQKEEVRKGFNPDEPEVHNPEADHNLTFPFAVEGQTEEQQRQQGIKAPISKEVNHWETKDLSKQADIDEREEDRPSPSYGSFSEERHVWSDE